MSFLKNLKIVDVTLRESTVNPEYSLSFKEKLEIAKQLDKLNTDVIEVGEIKDEKTDTLLIHTIARILKNSVLSVECGLTEKEIGTAWKAVSASKKPRLHLSVPVSSVKMEYYCHKKPEQVLEMIRILTAHARSLTADVEFTADDATRADRGFLAEVLNAAVEGGARIINLSDSAGTCFPEEMACIIADMKEKVPSLSGVRLSAECSNELGMAAASVFACVRESVTQIKTAIGPSLLPSMDVISDILRVRGDSLGVTCRLKTYELKNTLQKLNMITNTKRSATTVFDYGTQKVNYESTPLNVSADITLVGKHIKNMGYDLSKNDLAKVFESFSKNAEKKEISEKELEAIIASTALQVPPTYKLVSYVINSGNIITPTSHVVLDKKGEQVQGFSLGDGPIDAAFLAIEQITGHHFELDDFQIQSVTEGREAMGDALVKLRSRGRLYSGKGTSTDIIGASIHAYISALNKIVYEEK
ncbi:MAG: 2-isopropylmalate synthase [Firmicutes bacterium ADurb.Bin300]|nr:MAG: 2-isopropylmalate synthase [Firmicutes bacterium ADurb.Bin300]HOD02032.1 alpha-isopropylmalate synthase regulatory domain-containing protein [Clostridiales bacterium]